jgi:hypothetical protein
LHFINRIKLLILFFKKEVYSNGNAQNKETFVQIEKLKPIILKGQERNPGEEAAIIYKSSLEGILSVRFAVEKVSEVYILNLPWMLFCTVIYLLSIYALFCIQ